MGAAVENLERSILFCAHRCAARISTGTLLLLSESDSDPELTAGNSTVSSLVPSAASSKLVTGLSGGLVYELAAALSTVHVGDRPNVCKLESRA
jgi:hypothetical protein